MSQQLLQALLDTSEAFREQNMKEQNLCVFAFAQELYILSEKYVEPTQFDRFNTLLIQIIGDLAKRDYFSDEVSQEYFNIITALFQRSVTLFAS